MTTTGTTPPPDSAPPPDSTSQSPPDEPAPGLASPDLERPTLHTYRGVCSALARTTGTEVLLWRILFIVLAFFDGLGILLYLVGLLTIPREGERQSVTERLVRGPNRGLRRDEILLIALTVLVAGNMLDHGNNLIALAVITGIVLLFLQGRRDAPPREPVGTPPLVRPTLPRPLDPILDTTFDAPVPRAPRQKSALGALTLGLAVLVTAFLLLLNTAGRADIDAEVIIAAALAVVGAGLVVGAWWGRSPLLVLTAVALGLALAATSTAGPVLEAGVGERTWAPTVASDYRLGVGDATLDLGNVVLRETGPTHVTARVDVGGLTIILPSAVRVSVAMHADAGEIQLPAFADGLLFDRLQNRDINLGGTTLSGRDIDRELNSGPEGPTQIRVDASVRLGQITVIRRG